MIMSFHGSLITNTASQAPRRITMCRHVSPSWCLLLYIFVLHSVYASYVKVCEWLHVFRYLQYSTEMEMTIKWWFSALSNELWVNLWHCNNWIKLINAEGVETVEQFAAMYAAVKSKLSHSKIRNVNLNCQQWLSLYCWTHYTNATC